ncbi:homoserine O-acetyltransferase MetX [Falsibacillus albus]|uniref:Homoserine O-acetyltransferase n=1 Tax=Falsibacillus albus TaxID=2478915 RepID=A0A3L7JRP9_9BACI|nr:homoserine O-acetyltransferase [Falsibacillus albus]RLQ91182.1 homoserine O-acetyltransferase [Falsibacillus albus]
MELFSLDHEVESGQVSLEAIQLESGDILEDIKVAYERAGNLNRPVILVCHALTGNQHAAGKGGDPGWWSGLIGEQKTIDLQEWQVISMNVLGGCHGTTGPTSIDPRTQESYRTDFPFITIRDMAKVHHAALKELGIHQIHAAIGGSLGGMQVLELGIMYPDFVRHLFPLAVTPFLSDYGIAFNAIGRKAIINDPLWQGGNYDPSEPPRDGLSTARMVGMVTYRTSASFNDRFNRVKKEEGTTHNGKDFDVESYLHYQGEKLTKRFDANSYLYLLKAMDSHDIGRRRGGWKEVLKHIKADVTVIGYKGDLLYPPEMMKEMAEALPSASFHEVDTTYGHDGFLVEFEKWGSIIKEGLYDD